MTPPPNAERALYRDLNRLLAEMRDESLARIEAAIETRFRAFVKAHAAGGSAALEVVQAMTVHDGAEPWAVYRTEYRVVDAAARADHGEAADGGEAAADGAGAMAEGFGNVIPFPDRWQPRPAAAAAQRRPQHR